MNVLGPADLATGMEYVRSRLAACLNHLISLEVDGFRIDAAKHVPPGDIAAIESRFDGNPYVYREVVYRAVAVPRQWRRDRGPVRATTGDGVPERFAGVARAGVVFVDDHDTQRAGALTYQDGALYTPANVFEVAWPFGTPVVRSSFSFHDNDAGPLSVAGRTSDVTCGNG